MGSNQSLLGRKNFFLIFPKEWNLWGFYDCFGLAWITAGCPPKTTLSLPHLSWTGERKYDERLEGRDKDSERSLTNYCHGQNRQLGEKREFNPSPIKSD